MSSHSGYGYMRYFILVGLLIVANLNASNKEFTEKICSKCHSFQLVKNHDGNRVFWKDIIESMYKKEMSHLSKEDEQRILNYLSHEKKLHGATHTRRRLLKSASTSSDN